ncbi:dimethylamine monooxygenase subunit DmmA family protein [Pseudomonas sp. FEN]|uniref:dimethylamine monooxygenase subunit DmmA family protein n=1 Tax=Pseudomonas sp. FEN TaxID=2767468 RepID=UPI0017482882|nr:dimethylamine monooxygenase subunit DmmA family protein [Pseudomonas sp. FEN]
MMDRPSTAPDRLHSLPVYREPMPREMAQRHIVVMQSAAHGAAFVEGLGQALLLNAEGRDFPSRLTRLLADARVGSHLYILGDEAFIWLVHDQARSAGLLDDEIDMTLSAPGSRRVYCVHCGLTQAAGAANRFNCIGCQVQLAVRAHFSKRLGAYLGVCDDADHPYAGAQS